MEMGSPPGYSVCAWPPGMLSEDFKRSDDYRRFWAMPEAVRAELLAYYESVRTGGAPARDGPCLWLDPQTKRCRHYEHRPDICREFPVGGLSCLGWRRDFGLPVPDGTPPAGESPEGLVRFILAGLAAIALGGILLALPKDVGISWYEPAGAFLASLVLVAFGVYTLRSGE
jgi:hypothetical protein